MTTCDVVILGLMGKSLTNKLGYGRRGCLGHRSRGYPAMDRGSLKTKQHHLKKLPTEVKGEE
ncbi:MAG: hypothetical protein WD889_03290 [Candidatus Colwellbacteria bacterium]